MKKTIGFFGGSFDPIHFGHINLAIEMLEKGGVDEILFCPAFCSPFKTVSPPKASPSHRLAMLRLALEPIVPFRITTIELDRGGPSYTIDTLRQLQTEGEFRLILSDESIAKFDHWKEAQELIRLAPPLIGSRKEFSEKGPVGALLKKGLIPTRIFEVSGAEIRERINKKLYCGHLVPGKVLDYIYSHRLYF